MNPMVVFILLYAALAYGYIYDADVERKDVGIVHQNCQPMDRCEFKILPHDEKTIQLDFAGTFLPYQWYLEVYLLRNTGDRLEEIYYQTCTQANKCGYLQAEVGWGFLVLLRSNDEFSFDGTVRFNFERFDVNPDQDCGDPMVHIEQDVETTIQQSKQHVNMAGCHYYLNFDVVKARMQKARVIVSVYSKKSARVDIRTLTDQTTVLDHIITDHHNVSMSVGVYEHMNVQVKHFRFRHLQFPKVTVLLTNRTCGAKNKLIKYSTGELVVKSPGYPGLSCTNVNYLTMIQPRVTSAYTNSDRKSFFMITVASDISIYDELLLTAYGTELTIPQKTQFDMDIMIDYANFDIKYSAHAFVHQRSFLFKIQKVDIDKNCVCTTYRQKVYTEDKGELSIVIPSSCDMMYCSWFFRSQKFLNTKYKNIVISMEEAIEQDEIALTDDTNQIRFTGKALEEKRTLAFKDDIVVTFHRKNGRHDKDVTLKIEWFESDAQECQDSEIEIENSTVVLTSPLYPFGYPNMMKCNHLVTAQPGHTIQVRIEHGMLEPTNDYVTFYDGNSTSDKIIKILTGDFSDTELEASGNQMLISFHSDIQNSAPGFHMKLSSVAPQSVNYEAITNDTEFQLYVVIGCGSIATLMTLSVIIYFCYKCHSTVY